MYNKRLDILNSESMNRLLSEESETQQEMISRNRPDVVGRSSLSTLRDKKGESRKSKAFKLDFTGESLLNGIILAEVLGKPKCLKRSRR